MKKILEQSNQFKFKPRQGYIESEGLVQGTGGRRGQGKGKIQHETQPVTVMFDPRIPGGKLLPSLRDEEEVIAKVTKKKLRLVEEVEVKLCEAL